MSGKRCEGTFHLKRCGVWQKQGGEAPFDENSDPKPLGEYGKMKLLVEKEFSREERFKTLRLSYVFSKDDKFMESGVLLGKKGACEDISPLFPQCDMH